MKRMLALGLLIVTTSVTSILLFHSLTKRPDDADGVIWTKLHSTILSQERDIVIYLPPHLDSSKKYPVMYTLDGDAQAKHLARAFDVLSNTNYAPKTIIVGIPNMTAENRQRQLIPPFMAIDREKAESPKGEADKFLTFIETELIPFIEKNYPASQTRLFSGHSRAGLCVMYSLIYKADLFNARLCFSTPFWREDSIMISKISDFLDAQDSSRTFIYVSVGEKEGEKGFGLMTKVLQDRAPTGLGWYAHYTMNADHQTNAEISAPFGIARWNDYLKSQIEMTEKRRRWKAR